MAGPAPWAHHEAMIWKTVDRIRPSLDELDGDAARPTLLGPTTIETPSPVERRSTPTRVQLIGSYLRAEGAVDIGSFHRLSDYVNVLDGFFTLSDVVLLSRLGEPTRVTFPDFRVRLDDIAIVGQGVDAAPHSDDRAILKQRRRLVVTTGAHIIYGYAYLHEDASLTAFVDSNDPPFMPMTNVRVRWLTDRRLAGRFPFALVHRRKIIGVATEPGSGPSLRDDWGGPASAF